MSWTFEEWKNGRFMIHRDENGKFVKGIRHLPKKWKDNVKKSHNTKEFRLQLRNKRLGNSFFAGRKHTIKTREKISVSLLGRKLTEEHKRKISKSMKGVKHSDETKNKIRNTLKGIPLTEDRKNNISKACREHWKIHKRVRNSK